MADMARHDRQHPPPATAGTPAKGGNQGKGNGMTELTPCPFCGAPAIMTEPKTINGMVHGGYVGCRALVGCFHPHVKFDPRSGSAGAIAAWNKRADPPNRPADGQPAPPQG